MAHHSEKIPRLRNGGTASGKYQLDLSLNKARTKFLTLVMGKPIEGFVGIILKTTANGIALGMSLWFFQISLAFVDDDHEEKSVYQYGLFLKNCLVVYLPQRYVLWER